MEKEHLTPSEMDQILNKKSGLLGISGVSSDDRDVTKAAAEGNQRAQLAHDILEYQISKFIGGYLVALGGCDAIVFTAGVGENQSHHRQVVGEYLKFLGVKIDPELNEKMVLGKEAKSPPPIPPWRCTSSPPTRSWSSPGTPRPWWKSCKKSPRNKGCQPKPGGLFCWHFVANCEFWGQKVANL